MIRKIFLQFVMHMVFDILRTAHMHILQNIKENILVLLAIYHASHFKEENCFQVEKEAFYSQISRTFTNVQFCWDIT